MAHVVVDQAKGKAPVHECQAPLQRRITVHMKVRGGTHDKQALFHSSP